MTSETPRDAWIRPLRLWCGLLLITFIFTHFVNHALGLISLAAMEAARIWFLALWRNPAAETLLLAALLAHWLLGLWLIYRRHTLRMPAWEAMQIIFGLSVPPLLVYHVYGTRVANAMFGTEDLYTRIVLNYWITDPWAGIRQLALFTCAWVHGCIGLHFWLRIRRWYARLLPMLLSAVVLVPVLAVLGVTQAGREVSQLARDPGFAKRLAAETRAPSAEQRARLVQVRDEMVMIVWVLLGLTFAARVVRGQISRRRSAIEVSYLDGRSVRVPVGWTVLEASRSAGIPHASVCGGRGRCSTCRIRIAGDPALQPTPSPLERRVLDRIAAPPTVRLACQLRPSRDLAVTPLLQAAIGTGTSHAPSSSAGGGDEREIAILFADLRGFTRVAERKLPYDVVFLLNRYFEAVGGAVAHAGGVANQYTGDGVMALFGVAVDADTACRQAIIAAGGMIERLEALSRVLGGELEKPLRMGIGIHAGSVVVGEMGYAGTRYLTAVGDTVNTASRLEALTKDYGCELVISEEAIARAGLANADYPRHELALRNRDAPLRVVVVDNARVLADRVRSAEKVTA